MNSGSRMRINLNGQDSSATAAVRPPPPPRQSAAKPSPGIARLVLQDPPAGKTFSINDAAATPHITAKRKSLASLPTRPLRPHLPGQFQSRSMRLSAITARHVRSTRLLTDAYTRGYQPGLDGIPCELFPASITRSEGNALTQLVVQESATHTVEAGLANGMATLAICCGFAELDGSAKHISFDPHQYDFWHGPGARAVNDLRLSRWVEIRSVPSQLGLAQLALSGSHF